MFASCASRKWLLIVTTFVAVALTFIVIERSGPKHPEFGRIYQTHFDETPKGWEKITRGPLRSLFNDTAGSMRLGSTLLLWSLANNTQSPKTGYLYFGEQPLHNKWEFAPCRHTRLADVKHQDLDCEFYGKRHPRGKEAFGDSWRTNCLYVAEGQVLFARPVSDPSVIYVIQLAKQGGDSNSGNILIKYFKVRNQKRPKTALEPTAGPLLRSTVAAVRTGAMRSTVPIGFYRGALGSELHPIASVGDCPNYTRQLLLRRFLPPRISFTFL